MVENRLAAIANVNPLQILRNPFKVMMPHLSILTE